MFKRFFLSLFFILGMLVYAGAQPGGCEEVIGCEEECGNDCNSPECEECIRRLQIPIDGGILVLLLAGVGYGFKKIAGFKKKE
jgi:hypothetical protein